MNLSLGKKIKELRKAHKLNQTEMAERLGVHLQTVSRYERGELVPGPEVLSALAENFDLDLNTLLHGDYTCVKEVATGYTVPKKPASKEEAIKRVVVVLEGMTEEKIFEVLKYAEERQELLFHQMAGRGTRHHAEK